MIGRRNLRSLTLKVTMIHGNSKIQTNLQDIPDSFSPIKVHLILTL